MKEPIYEYVKRRLNGDFRDRWQQIADDIGVNYSTVYRVAHGTTNPELDNVQRMIDWFDARDAMVAKLRETAP